ncbi:MAG: hypothetical protein KDA33_04325 [Phycisphaerales bacterium]|nr:hypothetical protein [Phycisphaerales bacterium]
MNLWVLMGVLAPWLAGMSIVRTRRAGLAGLLLTLGGGWLVGQVLLFLLLFAMLRLTGASHAGLVSGLSLLIAVAVTILRRDKSASKPNRVMSSVAATGPTGGVVVILAVLFAISLGAKLLGIVPGLSTVTIRDDDATTFWLFKAKVIAESDHLSFDKEDPYYLGGANPQYPVYLPLCAAYLPLMKGGWSETLATFPWFGFFVATPLTILGALRLRLGAWPPALIAAYFVMSLPLASVHAYRPGYADMPMAAFLAAAVCFMLIAQLSERRIHYIAVALVLLIGAGVMKREGHVLAAVVAAVMLAPEILAEFRRGAKDAWRLVAALAIAIVVVFALVDNDDVVSDVSQLGWHGEAIASLANHAFGWASFNLAFWLAPAAIIIVALSPKAVMRWRALALTVALLGVDVCVFTLTKEYVFALNDQTPSRLFLQILPTIIVALAVPVTTAFERRESSSPNAGATS